MSSINTGILIFFTYAFLGWCTEVVYAYGKKRQWINRGFLNGPLCPIYGVGLLCMDLLVRRLGSDVQTISITGIAFMFLLVTLVTTTVELITGAVLEKMFMTRWWDYSQQKFNYKGYICLRFSLVWGVAGTVLLTTIHPVVRQFLESISNTVATSLIYVLVLGFAIDLGMTIQTMVSFKSLLIQLEKTTDEYLGARERLISELEARMSQVPASATRALEEMRAVAKLLQQQSKTLRAGGRLPLAALRELSKRKRELDKLLPSPIYTNLKDVHNSIMQLTGKLSAHRLFKAFPDMRSEKFDKQLKAIREFYFEQKNGWKKRGK